MYLAKLYLKFKRYQKQVWQWLWSSVAILLLNTLRLFPAKLSINFCGRLAQRLGPLTSRHRLMLNNLRLAYPQYTADECHNMANDIWWHMGSLFAEYIFLDKIMAMPGAIEVENQEILTRLASNTDPKIFFTAHIANFEILPILAAQFNLEISVLFRPPNSKLIAKKLFEQRRKVMSNLVPSVPGAAWQLAKTLKNHGNIGVLVDQKVSNGIDTTFFGVPAKTNPLAIKLARQYNCSVFPVRCVRLATGKYKIIFYEALTLPKSLDAGIDINAACQMLNDVVEEWVRDTPQQWMWFHNRWRC